MVTQKMFKRTYLHIGLGKTGSSAIQHQLYQHADLLELEHDIHFPRALDETWKFDGNHSRFLGAMFVDENGLNRAHVVAGFHSPKELANYASTVRSNFEKGFATSTARQLLISAEGIGHFSKPRLRMLAQWLRQFSEEIVIVACLRHPVDALSSEIQQRLKLGYVLEDMYEAPPFYKFRGLFERLDDAFPGCVNILYPFSEAIVDPRGLTGAFLEKIGVDINLPAPVAKRANASMSHEAALVLSAFNRARPLVVDAGQNTFRPPRMVMEFMKIPGRKFQAPGEVYEKLASLAEDELTWLQEQHGIELRAAPVLHEQDYNYFSDESIAEIAVRVGELSKLRYATRRPFRFFASYFRVVINNFLRKK